MAQDEQQLGSRARRLLTPEDYEAAWYARQNWVSPWKLVRENRIEDALESFRKNRGDTPPYKPGLGQVLMCTGQYELAVHHFAESIGMPKELPMRSETDYAFLGAARWCLHDYSSAFKDWHRGINAPYATGGLCSETPLLLLAGSILRPEHYNRAEAEETLRKKMADPRAGERTEHWPASLCKFVLGTIPKEAMAAWWIRTTSLYEVVMERHRLWRTEFYAAVLDLGYGRLTTRDFRLSMKERTQQSSFTDWELDQWEYLMRAPEFYIARFEATL